MSNPVDVDDELRRVYKDEAKYAVHLISLPVEDRPVHVMLRAKQKLADRKKHELQARIDEHSLWKPVAEEIVAKDGVYRAVNYLNKRGSELNEFKQELEKL